MELLLKGRLALLFGMQGARVHTVQYAMILMLAGGCARSPHDPNQEASHASTSSPATVPVQDGYRRAHTGEWANSVEMRFVWIPAGQFRMGSAPTEKWHERAEGRVHNVRISSPFWTGVHEVTQRQYQLVMGRNPSAQQTDPRLPVTNVTWNEAMEFCRALSQREGRTYRLPTEAEWEYACRAGMSTPWFFGDSAKDLHEYVVCGGHAAVDHPAPVGSRKPNPWGLYDVLGNVGEWVSDTVEFDRSDTTGGLSAHEFDLPPYPDREELDPKGQGHGVGRIVRGGSYVLAVHEKERPDAHFCACFCRCAARVGRYAIMASEDTGFRIVCDSTEYERASQQPAR